MPGTVQCLPTKDYFYTVYLTHKVSCGYGTEPEYDDFMLNINKILIKSSQYD